MTTANSARLTKQERVYRAIRDRILDGAYASGSRVVLDAIAAEFKVSALPVREAIWRLEAEGLVVYRPNAGVHVAPADPEMYAAELTVFALLEGYATAVAAPLLIDDEIAQLKVINRRMEQAVEGFDPLGFVDLNQEFHDTIYERCPNPVLVDLLRDTTEKLEAVRRNVFLHVPYRGGASVVEHDELVALIEARAPEAEIEFKARIHKLHAVENFRTWQRERGEASPPREPRIGARRTIRRVARN